MAFGALSAGLAPRAWPAFPGAAAGEGPGSLGTPPLPPSGYQTPLRGHGAAFARGSEHGGMPDGGYSPLYSATPFGFGASGHAGAAIPGGGSVGPGAGIGASVGGATIHGGHGVHDSAASHGHGGYLAGGRLVYEDIFWGQGGEGGKLFGSSPFVPRCAAFPVQRIRFYVLARRVSFGLSCGSVGSLSIGLQYREPAQAACRGRAPP